MYKHKIQQIVEQIKSELNINKLPVDVRLIAERSGIAIREGKFDDELSGFAVRGADGKVIGVNKDESYERQRFTIAHELGHLFLHHHDRVNYDAGSSVMLLRDAHSSDGTDLKEIEANRFAAELLMPEKSLRQDIAEVGGVDLMNGNAKTRDYVRQLANKYEVSPQAMAVRLTTLYFN